MNENRHLPLPAKSIVAVLLVVVCVMFFMAWANVAFRDSGHNADLVHYASRITGLPVLALLVWLVVREHREFLTGLFSTDGLTIRLILTGIAVGLLARIFWWSQITARTSFGWSASSMDAPPQPLSFGFSCPEIQTLAMAIVVWWILVPVTEEFVHRGVLMSAFSDKGPAFAVSISALIFSMMHRPGSFFLVLAFGLVFGILFWNSRTLWAPIFAHATYNGIVILDWHCLKTSWNPSPVNLPMISLGITSGFIAAACAAGIAFLISKRWVGLHSQSNPSEPLKARSRHAL